MSDSMGSPSAHDGTRSSAPRAVIHKRILDVAEAQPDASMERIAGEVSGASVDLVEQVLEEYGDPASESSGAVETSDGSDRATDAHAPVDSAEHEESERESAESTADADEPAQDAAVTTEDAGESAEDADESAAAADEPAEPGATAASAEDADGSGASESATSAEDGASEFTETAAPREPTSAGASSDDAGPVTDPAELTPKQRETFRLIYERPDAPQQEIADALGVTRATVSRRVNDADGFDWDDRRAFVARLFDGEPDQSPGGAATHERAGQLVAGRTASSDGGPHRTPDERNGGAAAIRSPVTNGDGSAADGQALADAVDDLAERVARLEDAVESGSSGGNCGALADPDLAHKVVHACMDAEYVTEDEELRVLKSILGGD